MLKSVTIKMKHDENNYSNAQKTSVLFAAILILVPKGHWMALVIDRSSGTRYLIYLWVVCVCVFFLSKNYRKIWNYEGKKHRRASLIVFCLYFYRPFLCTLFFKLSVDLTNPLFNLFNATGVFLYPLKTENQRFPDIFRGYKEWDQWHEIG